MRNRTRVNNAERLPPFDDRPFLIVQNPDTSVQTAINLAPNNYPLRRNTARNLGEIYMDRMNDVDEHRGTGVERLLLELRVALAKNDYEMARDAMMRSRDLHNARRAERRRTDVPSTEVDEITVPTEVDPDPNLRQIV